MNIEEKREKFEAWANRLGLSLVMYDEDEGPRVVGKYVREKVQLAWEAWQTGAEENQNTTK